MPRRRFALIGALVLVPLLAFAVTRIALDGDDSVASASDTSTTTTTEATTSSTTTEVEATTSTAPTPTSTTTSTSTTPTTRAGKTATTPLPSVPRPGEPVAAADARGLADQIRIAETAITDPSTPPAEVQKQAHLQQVAYRALVNQPDRKAAVFALLDPPLRAIAEANVTAGGKLRSMIKTPKTSLPPWRIVAPAPADELLRYYKEAEAATGVPWHYLASINLVETRMGRIRGDSEAGAQGPMQFLPSTWTQYGNGGDINSNRDAILAAARLLKRNGAPADMRNAVFNYNHDTRYVDAVLAYGDRMAADERALLGYHGWQVYYVTTNGDAWLAEGYDAQN